MELGSLFVPHGTPVGSKIGRPGGAPRATRFSCALPGRLFRSALVLALVVVGWSSSSPPAGATGAGGQASSQEAGLAWLCQPGQAEAADPCAYNLAATAVTATGAVQPTTWPRSTTASNFDCFYVHPTDSLASAANTSTALTRLEAVVAVEQAAPLSQVCNVWAPSYESQTWSSVEKGLAGNQAVMRSTFAVAYNSVLVAWNWFLAHTRGRPVVVVGDSQGSAVLIHLINAEIDHQPSVLARLLVAVLVGGNLQVPSGRTVGATFTQVPLCASATETRCAIAFSSYPSQPPAGSVFGRPGQGVSLQSGQSARAGQQVACVNPAALGGGTADLDPYMLTATQLGLTEHVPTPWVTYPGLYSARCEQAGGASWLQVTSLAGASHTRPVVNDNEVGQLGGTGAAWGFHGYEYGLTLGNLLHDISGEEAAWALRH